MCLSNHDILVDRLLPALLKNKSPDLESGFAKELIAKDWYLDQEICEKELAPDRVEIFNKEIKNKNVSEGFWKIKTGIDKILG